MTEPLSPAAQAVAWAYNNTPTKPTGSYYWLAAALRAVADLVTPERYCAYTGHGEFDFGMEARNDAVREEILVIAAELEGSNG